MDKILLEAQKRTIRGKSNSELRSEGTIPAVAYGRGVEPEALTVDAQLAEKAYRHAGGNKIIGLKVDGGSTKNVLIYDVQRNPLRGQLTHLDFYFVRMDEELKAEVPLHFVGESTAVYQGEGTLLKNVEAVEVECLPGVLPESIEVDITVLDDFEKTITLADLKIPAGVKLTMEDLELVVAKVEPPRTEAQMAELEEELGDTVPEGVKEEQPIVVAEQNEGDKDRRDKK